MGAQLGGRVAARTSVQGSGRAQASLMGRRQEMGGHCGKLLATKEAGYE